MAESIASAGFCFIKFNFSHNGGTIENPIDFPDLEAFGNNNYTKELDDLEAVIDWILSEPSFKNEIDRTNIVLIGHSRGGGIVTIKASEGKRISKVITWAAVSNFGHRSSTKSELEQWKNDGVKYVLNGRTKQQMPHYYQFYEDYVTNEIRLNIELATRKIRIPHLIIHGDNDTSISSEEAKNLYSWNPESELVYIQGANHTFGSMHPWSKPFISTDLQRVVSTSIVFVNKIFS